ncbi:MAG: hypothetical protein I8H91_00510 [Burkholderiales bacterium]|nr:hypothetical protein [Burkholderiales bacterium]
MRISGGHKQLSKTEHRHLTEVGGVELPFDGVKSSGYGREKGFEALYGFTTLKTVAVRHENQDSIDH